MEALFVIILLGVVVAVVVARSSAKKKPELSAGNRAVGPVDPLAGEDAPFWALKAGDLVKQVGGPDFLVRRSLSCTEGGYRWNEHLLDDAQGVRKWLSVEDEDGLDLGLWAPITSADVDSGNAGDKTVVVSGVTYGLEEEGTANYSTVASGGQPTYGTVDYFQYEAPGGEMLAMQRYDQGNWEASVGEKVRSSDFEIFPSGGVQDTAEAKS